MTSKMISIKNEIYEQLKHFKNNDESFSDVIERLLQTQKKDPLQHFGNAKDLPEEVNEKFEQIIIEMRKDQKKVSTHRFTELWSENN